MIKLNKIRKEILLNIDNNISVSNKELEMYELTPYFEFDNNESLFDKIIQIENEKRRIMHIKDDFYSFMPLQLSALKEIENNSRIIISAPTSFGKTLIVKEYIYLHKPKVVVFIVPTNALAYELEKSFKTNKSFDFYDIFDKHKNEEISSEKSLLFIGTQEKFLEIKKYLPNIDFFVIDEAYQLEQSCYKQRGYKLSMSFLDSINSECKKICLLSPNAKFIGFDKYNFKEFNTYFNAVDKLIHIIDRDEFFTIVKEKAKTEKTILFCDSPSDINCILDKNINDNIIDSTLIKYLSNEFHPEWTVIKLLKQGVLSHHGLMPKYIQNKMINSFLFDEKYNLLVGTNSISEGINTPTKNLFIHPDCKIERKKLLIKNTIGRAGRLGKYPIGHIYYTESLENIISEDICITLSVSKEEEINEIEISKDETKMRSCCEKFDVDIDFLKNLISKYKISLTKMTCIFSTLKKNYKYEDLQNLPDMAFDVFREDYPIFDCIDDKIYIKGTLQKFYYDQDKNKRTLMTFDDKINFYKYRAKKPKDNISSIVDGYIKFMYSSLEYYILPIANVFKDIYTKYPNWKFGDNVVGTINTFLQKYYSIIYGIESFENLSENQKQIIQSLKEYGINISKLKLPLEMIDEINENLKVRYSMYDIIRIIKQLSVSSNKYRFSFKELFDTYFGN